MVSPRVEISTPVAAAAPGYASRARVGVIVPSANTCAEPELSALMPDGIALAITRLRLRSASVDAIRAMARAAEEAADLLADASPSLVLFHCTGASSLVDEGFVARLTAAARCPAATTADAIVAALEELGVSRPALVGPYPQDVADIEAGFFASRGISVSANVALDIQPVARWGELDPGYWIAAAREAATGTADSVIISCTNLRSAPAIAPLEAELGIPVVTSNQAAVWQAMRLLGIDTAVAGYGALLANIRRSTTDVGVGCA
jgi:maleate isomerase